MMASISPSWISQLDLADKQAPNFFRSYDELLTRSNGVVQIHAMRRAWQDLMLDGILYQDRSPYVYFKEVDQIDPAALKELHRRFWNQGIAPFLVIVSSDAFHVYSSLALPAKDHEAVDDGDRLVEVLSRTADILEIRQLTRSLQFGDFFHSKPKSFNPSLKVDRYLLKNLESARTRLLDPVNGVSLDIKVVHALLWRTIFISYLIDRKIIDSNYLSQISGKESATLLELLEGSLPQEAKQNVYNLFQKLKNDFNGDLFSDALSLETELVRDQHISILAELLRGDDLSSGQLALSFWAYDFSVIPIEMISGIYERFLEVEDSEQKRKTGTYYTPRFLAEIVLDAALMKQDSLQNKKILDPACGSGIFLVSLFSRIAEEWLGLNREASHEEHSAALIDILQNQIFGVDAEEAACRIAAFSLYLAFLDHLEPRDIQQLQRQGKVLPNLVGHNILCQDFFDDDLILPHDFDLVVGNPPWARASSTETLLEKWCERENFPIAQKQLAYGFIWKSPFHLKDSGQISFVLPSSILLNHHAKALTAQQRWLSTYKIEQVINLSDMRFYLFDGAIRPALVINYAKASPNRQEDSISYLVPKTEIETLKAEIISISPEDRVQIKLRELLYDLEKGQAALTWKQSFWGTPRDQKFLDRLGSLPRLNDIVDQLTVKPDKRTKRWLIGQGFQPEGKNDDPIKSKIPTWLPNQLFIEGKSKAIDLLLVESDCQATGNQFSRLRRLPDEKIFQKPHILISKGLKVAFADFDVVFRHAIQGLHAPMEDSDLLKFLAAILNSDLANYFMFHTSANWGTERDETHEEELLRFPFPFPENTVSPEKSREILQEVGLIINHLKVQISQNILNRKTLMEQSKRHLYVLICRYYQIDEFEQILIEDTISRWIPSSTPNRGTANIPTLKNSSSSEREEYLNLLCRLLNTWSSRSRYHVSGEIISSPKSGMGVIILHKNARQASPQDFERTSSSKLDEVLERISRLLPQHEGSMAFYRNLKVFDGDKLYILKPLAFRLWSKTFALNDADEIAAAILTHNR
jgi:type I restriction-modification system DNA methylase subunit